MKNCAPDRRRFDRTDGYQLLYIINFFGISVGRVLEDQNQNGRVENRLINKFNLKNKNFKYKT
jgi:hypothetical protein